MYAGAAERHAPAFVKTYSLAQFMCLHHKIAVCAHAFMHHRLLIANRIRDML